MMCSSVECKVHYLSYFCCRELQQSLCSLTSGEYDYHHLFCPDFDVSVMENRKDWASERGIR
jgi:hypothetical protein